MPNFSLIFARDLQFADDSALLDWHWERYDELHSEFRRPDNNERARFVPDGPQSLQNLRWNTKVYLGRGWERRADAHSIRRLIGDGFFVETDPNLPPPRRRTMSRDGVEPRRSTLR